MMAIKIQSFTGLSALPFRKDLAELRIAVFREFPYLYEGSLEYESGYLEKFIHTENSIVVVAFDGDKVVGASTGMPLQNEVSSVLQPWKERGEPMEHIFYFSESVLLPAYRGQGIGREFFAHREQWARSLGGYSVLTFCGVIRPADHPARPFDYVDLNEFWQHRGFYKKEGYICEMAWKEVGATEETKQQLQFWEKNIGH